jgi:hypothetical protein
MSEQTPAHQANPETVGLTPLFDFTADASATPPGQRARPRPPERPRPADLEDEAAEASHQFFEGSTAPVPPGTMAKPRPKGRERDGEGPSPVPESDGGPPRPHEDVGRAPPGET